MIQCVCDRCKKPLKADQAGEWMRLAVIQPSRQAGQQLSNLGTWSAQRDENVIDLCVECRAALVIWLA